MGGGDRWQAAQSANKSRRVWGYRPRTVRLGVRAVELVGTGCRVPGRVKSPHAVDVTQPRVLFRVCPLHFAEVACILRASACPSASARPEALVPSGTRGLYTTRGLRFNDSTGDGPSLRGGLKIESPKTRKGPCEIILRPRWENHRGSVATAMVQQFRTGTSPVPQRIRGDSGTCSTLHFAGVPGKQQVSCPSILRGFRFSQGRRARAPFVFGIRNSCIGEAK